jgi:plastocyanin
MYRARITGLVIAASVALAGCGGAAGPTTAPASLAATAVPPGPAATVAEGTATSPPSNPALAASNDVAIQDFAFAPASLTVTSGTTVTWTNLDAPTHSVRWDDGTTGSDRLATGATYARTFTTPGTYTYACGIHASMKGTIVVH